MSDSRQAVLQRIREALKVPARQPHAAAEHSHASHSPEEKRAWLPKVGPSFEQQVELFAKNSLELKTEFLLAKDETEARQKLLDLITQEAWPEVAAHAGSLTSHLLKDSSASVFWLEPGYCVDHLERCPAGITECDALVAQTGSVLMTSRSAGGRALSILPPHHIVLARRGQLVADLTAAYEVVRLKYAPHYPSLISFITGPSRTGDIERILVLGAHGPKRLTILVW